MTTPSHSRPTDTAPTASVKVAAWLHAPAKARRVGAPTTAGEAPRNFPNAWVSFIENVWDEEDFAESLVTLEGLVGPSYLPLAPHIHQLLALALSPSSLLSPKSLAKHLKPASLDPLVSTARKIRLEALRLLQDIAATNSPAAIFRATPGYPADESLEPREETPDPFSEKKERTRLPPVGEHSYDAEEEDKPLVLAGKMVARCHDLWDFLGGGAGRGRYQTSWTREEPIVRRGWELLRGIVGMWEDEVRERKELGQSALSPSFLRQFKPTPYGPRTSSYEVLDAVFWPFSEFPPPDDVDEVLLDDDEMESGEKQRVAARLVGLLANLALVGRLEPISLIQELTTRLKALSPHSFSAFLSLLPPLPLFTIRLCQAYLERYSHSSPHPSTSAVPISSPRRRVLGTNPSREFTSPASAAAHKYSFFALPDRATLVELLGKVPSEVPKEKATQARRPQRAMGFAGVERAAKGMEEVKMVLVEAVEELGVEVVEVARVETGKVEGVVAEARRNAAK